MATSYETTQDIDVPVEQVWAIMTDVESMPQWTPSMDKVTLLGAERRLDLDVRASIEQPGMRAAVWVVDEWNPMSSFSWTSRVPGVRTHARHVVVPAVDRTCRVTFRVSHHGPLARLVGALTMERTKVMVDQELSGLKAAAERAVA